MMLIVTVHRRGRKKFAVSACPAGTNPKSGCVLVRGGLGDISCPTFTARGAVGGVAGQGGSGRGRVLVGSERSGQGGLVLLEEDALSFLNPRVVLHQLGVQKGILWDTVLYPLNQAVQRERDMPECV